MKKFSKQNLFLLLFSLLFVSLFLAYFVYSSPSPTIIGEDISTNNLSVSQDLSVEGNATIGGNATTTGNLNILGNLNLSGIATFLKNLSVSGTSTLSTTTISGNLDVSGSVRASKALTVGINVESLTGNKTLTPGEDAMYQYLDPNGANRIIYLATSTAKAGDRFVIRNTVSYNYEYYLSIKQGGTELDRIYSGIIKEFIFDGTNWISASNGSGEYNQLKVRNVGIGAFSSCHDMGTAVGYEANGSDFGVAVGYQASGADHSVAVGQYASASVNSVTVGYDADSSSEGTAVGYKANGSTRGAAVGAYANGSNYGTAVGWNAKGFSYGTAVGYYAMGMRYGAALGYQAGRNIDINADRYNIVIGAFSGYRLTYGTSNIIIGYKAGEDSTYSPTTGSNNILIGTKAWTPTTSTSDFLNIGGLIFGTGLSREPNTLASGNVGIGVSDPAYKLQIAGDIVPSSDNAYDLGKSTLRWANLYAASTTVGDLIFNNNFRIVETQPEEKIQGIIIKNQKNETIATFKENGELKLEGGISLGNENSPAGITLYDKITKKPYCLEIADGEIVIREGECQR